MADSGPPLHLCKMTVDQDNDLHVIPRYGQKHEASVTCWCLPRLSSGFKVEEKARVWVHREQN